MKRHAIAFLLHPYKNTIIERVALKQAIDSFAQKFLDLAASYQNLRFNLVLPGYVLECIDPILLLRLREVQKRGGLEWLSCGYTEPFISFSPWWLSQSNIRYGLDVFAELTGVRPAGYVPPFSNWEPSYIESLNAAGIHYVLLTKTLFPRESLRHLGYWTTEYAGASTALFPTHLFHRFTAPQEIGPWLDEEFAQDDGGISRVKLLCLDYLIPLGSDGTADALTWLSRAAAAIEKLLLRYQPILFSEFLTVHQPAGLQYIPSSLALNREETETHPYFLNYLHTHDQVGLLQRKMMEIAELIEPHGDSKYYQAFKKKLFFAQDINRYLPSAGGGFPNGAIRSFCYEKLIEIEDELHQQSNLRGGQIKIVDFLKNGSKNVIMSNKPLKVYIDHRRGGQVIEMDFRPRALNLCAGFSQQSYDVPRITMPGRSKTMFCDHIVNSGLGKDEMVAGAFLELGDFVAGPYDYKIKKTNKSLKALLSRNGSILQGEKSLPLFLEKVFGLDGDDSILSFVYQFSNHSLISCSFKLAIELTLLLPGAAAGKAQVSRGRVSFRNLTHESFALSQATKWVVEDFIAGCKLVFVTQKPVDVWCFPVRGEVGDPGSYQGTTFVLSTPVALDESAPWTLMGRIECQKKKKAKSIDAL
jgi:hypothetical protein